MNFKTFTERFPENPNDRFEYPSCSEAKLLSDKDKTLAFDFLLSRVSYHAGREIVSLLFCLDKNLAAKKICSLIESNKLSDSGKVQFTYELSKDNNDWKPFTEITSDYKNMNKEARNLFWLLLPEEEISRNKLTEDLEHLIKEENEKLPKIQGAQKVIATKGLQEGSREFINEYKRILGR